MYFTRNDNPHAGKSNLQNEAAKKFKDFGKVELSVVVFNDEFQWNKFYSVSRNRQSREATWVNKIVVHTCLT